MISECNLCRRLRAMAREKTADMPQDCLLPDKPAFMKTGMDYFGPSERTCHNQALWSALHMPDSHSSAYRSQRFPLTLTGVLMLYAISKSDDKCQSFAPTMARIWLAQRENWDRCWKNWTSPVLIKPWCRKEWWIFNPPAASHHGSIWECNLHS